MAKIDLSKYGITGTTEIVYNPSYEVLFEEETKPELEGFEKGQVSELGAVNVMTGIYTGRSPKDKYISLLMKIPKILYGGHLTNTRMITTPLPRKHGRQSRNSLRKNFPIRNCTL